MFFNIQKIDIPTKITNTNTKQIKNVYNQIIINLTIVFLNIIVYAVYIQLLLHATYVCVCEHNIFL